MGITVSYLLVGEVSGDWCLVGESEHQRDLGL